MTILHHVLDIMNLDSRFKGRSPERSPRLYVKVLVLKELCKVLFEMPGAYPSYALALRFLSLR
jgi:hypothetical protein